MLQTFGVMGGLYAAVGCFMQRIRQKQDGELLLYHYEEQFVLLGTLLSNESIQIITSQDYWSGWALST